MNEERLPIEESESKKNARRGIVTVPLQEVAGEETVDAIASVTVETERAIVRQLESEPPFEPHLTPDELVEIEPVASKLAASSVEVSTPKIEVGLPSIGIVQCNVENRVEKFVGRPIQHADAVIMAYMFWQSIQDKVSWDEFAKSVHIFGLGDFPNLGDTPRGMALTGSKFNPLAGNAEDLDKNPQSFGADTEEEEKLIKKFLTNGLAWVHQWMERAHVGDKSIPWLYASCGGHQLICAGSGAEGERIPGMHGAYRVSATPELSSLSPEMAERFDQEGGELPIIHSNNYVVTRLSDSPHTEVVGIYPDERGDVAMVGLRDADGETRGITIQGHPELPGEFPARYLNEDVMAKKLVAGELRGDSQVGGHYNKKVTSLAEAGNIIRQAMDEMPTTEQAHLIFRTIYKEMIKER